MTGYHREGEPFPPTTAASAPLRSSFKMPILKFHTSAIELEALQMLPKTCLKKNPTAQRIMWPEFVSDALVAWRGLPFGNQGVFL